MYEDNLKLEIFRFNIMAETIEAIPIQIETNNHVSLTVFTLRNMVHMVLFQQEVTKFYRLNSNFSFNLIQTEGNFEQPDYSIDLISVPFYK